MPALKHNYHSYIPGMVEVLGPWLLPVEAVVSEPTAGARIKSMSPSVEKTKTLLTSLKKILIIKADQRITGFRVYHCFISLMW